MAYRDSAVRDSRHGEVSRVNREPHILPLVHRIREQIDQVFARYVGPISSELSQEEFGNWRDEGQVGPRALHRYIARLARYVSQADQREAFINEATKCIQSTR